MIRALKPSNRNALAESASAPRLSEPDRDGKANARTPAKKVEAPFLRRRDIEELVSRLLTALLEFRIA